MGRHTGTGGSTRRRAAGVVVGLVIASGAAGAVSAFAADAPLGCPSGYTLSGGTCRNDDGGTTYGLPMLPGDRDPGTGLELVPAEVTTDPVPTPTTTTPPVVLPSTTTAPPVVLPSTTTAPPVVLPSTTTAPPVVLPSTTPKPTTSTTPPVVVLPSTTTAPPVVLPSTTPRPGPQPCRVAGQAPDPAAVARTQAAIDRARALLVADVRRGASTATLRADAASVVSAVGAHAQTVAAQRPC